MQGLRRRSRYWIARRRGVNRAVVRAQPPARCATCGRAFAAGEKARRDEWHEPVFGRTLASLICVDCADAGL